MAVLKKGSKGKIVEYLQAALNKLKAKPPLKVDGIFGPKTQDAVKQFQKRANLKADGQVGELTEASIRYGGPLPEMKVEDYEKRTASFEKHRKYNTELLAGLMRIRKIVDLLENDFNQNIFPAVKLSEANSAHWEEVLALGRKIASFQKDFKRLRLKDPKTAQKIADTCAAHDKKLMSDAKTKISPNFNKMTAMVRVMTKALTSSLSKINSEYSALKKNMVDF